MNNLPFSSLPIRCEILQNLAILGFDHMTPIQESSLPEILTNKDLICHAKTGSGKTASFAIGLLSKLDIKNKAVQALVLCPTRELSEQVSTEIRKLARLIPNVKITTLCGGSAIKAQESSLKNGVHCVIGTPGRVSDHIRRNNLNLASLETLVLDEADRMLEMGFLEDMSEIVKHTPRTRQTLLFSATYPANIQNLSNNFQKNALLVKADTDHKSLNIEHFCYEKNSLEDLSLLLSILSRYRPESTLIFCNTKQKCQELAHELVRAGFYAQSIHGDLDQRERDEALILFSNKSLSILVATDVAARGLDIKDLQAVINYDLAHDAEIHTHRIGRTARAGHSGLAFSLYNSHEKKRLSEFEAYRDKDINYAEPPINSGFKTNLVPTMATLRISCGRKNKLRAGDILGALTAHQDFLASDVGKIDIGETHSFVAVTKAKIDVALKVLSEDKIKGRFLKVIAMKIYVEDF
jgi:ATP-independent RNA helicase DbpA